MRKRLNEQEKQDLDARVAAAYTPDTTIPDLCALFGLSKHHIMLSLGRCRRAGAVPLCRPPRDTDMHIRRYVQNGGLRRVGTLREITETLTPAQVDKLLDGAPKAESYAQAIAIFLATHVEG